MPGPAKVYVGYDAREDIAWQVCRLSLERHAGRPLHVHPLKQATLRELGLYTRPVDATATTGPSAANSSDAALPVTDHSTMAPPTGARLASRGNPGRAGSGSGAGRTSGRSAGPGGSG